MKKFTSAGVSKDPNGRLALRASNRDEGVYAKLLDKEGHKDVHIIVLKTPMTKDEARKYLKGLKAFQTPEILKCLSQEDVEDKKATKKATKEITKPTQTKKPKSGGNKKKKKEEPAAEAEVATQEQSDEDVDVTQEHDIPAAAKHFAED